MPKTLGQLLLSDAIPEDMRDDSRVFNKKTSGRFFADLAEKHPEKYADVLHSLNGISRIAGTEEGGMASIRLQDLGLPPKVQEYRNNLRGRITAIQQDPRATSKTKNESIVSLMRTEMPKIQTMINEETSKGDNTLGESIKQGFRGNPVQLTQLLFGDMLVADQKGKAIPVPGLNGYGEGVTPMQYFAGAFGSRKGYSEVQFMTAKAGFLGKQVALSASRLQVTEENCGADAQGILISGDNSDILGRVLAREVAGLPAGTTVEKKHLPKLRKEKILSRSLATCQTRNGVCQKCSGKRNKGRFPEMGAYVGIDTGRLMSEPITQAGLSSKHTGGIIGGKQFADEVSGFDEINQFVQVPKSFRGASVLAPQDAIVQNIVDADQGGKYVMIGGEQLYVPRGREVLVKKGEKVEAGDMLTDGTPNPAEMVKHKGIGEARVYFINKFGSILKDNGVKVQQRHVETLSRAFFDRIKITDPDGVAGYSIDDVVTYSDMQRDYKPRADAEDRKPGTSVGMYLEKPTLHYSIGTRVTPKVVNFMKEQKVGNISVHKSTPGFEPHAVRMMDIPGTDPDFKNKLTGFGLKKSIMQDVQLGATSRHDAAGYAGKLMDPSKL
jgi:DNA-directed RNA polymerase subunit beta'